MKIIQINAVYEIGSTGRLVMELHNYLLSKGMYSYVFCANIDNKQNNIFKIGNLFDHKLHSLFSKIFGLQGFFSVFYTIKLLRKIKSINPDVIHLHNLHSNFINYPILFKFIRRKNYSTVITLHDCWFFTGHCCHYTEILCYKWLKECDNCPLIKDYNTSWFFDFSFLHFNVKKKLISTIPNLAIIGNSEWTTQQAKLSFLKKAKIIKRIYNWVDTKQFCQFPIINNNQFTIIGISQYWSVLKGINIFLKIAERYKDTLIILIGNIDNQIKLPNNVKAVGLVSNREELIRYIKLSDVLINCSTQETFGLISAEALACGTPIIVNNATANPELVCDGCGYVANNLNITSYFNAIDLIRKNTKKYYTNKCVEFAKKNFKLDINIEQYIEVYKIISK